MCRSQHCLHHLLRPLCSVDNLRELGHSFSLPDYNTNTHELCSLIFGSFWFLLKKEMIKTQIWLLVVDLYCQNVLAVCVHCFVNDFTLLVWWCMILVLVCVSCRVISWRYSWYAYTFLHNYIYLFKSIGCGRKKYFTGNVVTLFS